MTLASECRKPNASEAVFDFVCAKNITISLSST